MGHPGHELLVGQILSDRAATVFWLTDGSGAAAYNRNSYTRALLADAQCAVGPGSGSLDDKTVYAAILAGDPGVFDQTIEALAAQLARDQPATLLTDPYEYFNPSHDLANTIADIVPVKSARRGIRIRKCVYANEYPELFDQDRAVLSRRLGAAEMAVKMRRLEAYVPLFAEWKRLEHGGKLEDMATERMFADEIRLDQIPVPQTTRFRHAFYETYGRNAVARGAYKTCITFADNVLPFTKALVRRHLGRAALSAAG